MYRFQHTLHVLYLVCYYTYTTNYSTRVHLLYEICCTYDNITVWSIIGIIIQKTKKCQMVPKHVFGFTPKSRYFWPALGVTGVPYLWARLLLWWYFFRGKVLFVGGRSPLGLHIGGYSPLRPNEEARADILPSHPSFTNKFVPWVVPTSDISIPSFWTEKHHTLTSKGERHLWRKFIFNINCEKYNF